MTSSNTTAKNSYGVALLAIVVGVLFTVAYVYALVFIPYFIIIALIPLAIALFLIALTQAAVRGGVGFRVAVAVIATLANLVAIWFAAFAAHWGLDIAVLEMSKGPGYVLETIVYLSNELSFKFGDAKDVVRGGGINITGVWLLVLWVIEALLFVLAALLGFFIGNERQDLRAGAGLASEAGEGFKSAVPVAKGAFWGIFKSLAQIGIVFGVIYLLSEYVW